MREGTPHISRGSVFFFPYSPRLTEVWEAKSGTDHGLRKGKTTLKRDPKHEQALEALLHEDVADLGRRFAITDWQDPGYIAPEVMATICRQGLQPKGGFLDRASSALYQRLTGAVGGYLRRHPQWNHLVEGSSEFLAEMTSEIWTKLLTDKRGGTSLCEVRFWPWLEARALEYLRMQITLKNTQEVSLETLPPEEEDGEPARWENLIAADLGDGPEAVVARQRQHESVMKRLMELPPQERQAVYYRLEFQYDWPTVAKFIGCSIPTARSYYKSGYQKLIGEIE